MLLPVRCLARHVDEAGVIGQALALAAAGLGHRPIAESRAVIPASAEAKLIALSSGELLTLLRASVLAQPRRDLAHVLQRSQWTASPAPSRRVPSPLERSHRSGKDMTQATRSRSTGAVADAGVIYRLLGSQCRCQFPAQSCPSRSGWPKRG